MNHIRMHRAMVLRMVRRTAAAYAIASTRPRCGSSIVTTWKPKAMGPTWIKWRMSN